MITTEILAAAMIARMGPWIGTRRENDLYNSGPVIRELRKDFSAAALREIDEDVFDAAWEIFDEATNLQQLIRNRGN